MPKDKSIRKVLVIGSGPIVIGQAAEFDYAGAQACRVLREEGVNVVLVNSNPATIMTDRHLADEIYLRLFEENKRWYDAIMAVYLLEKPQKEVAREMGISLEVLHSMLYRAKKWIRKNYEKRYRYLDEA